MANKEDHYQPRFSDDRAIGWLVYKYGEPDYELWPDFYIQTPEDLATWRRATKTTKPKPGRLGINPKDAIGSQKVSFNNIPKRALGEVALAMMEGGLKYEPKNWRDAPVRLTVYTDAICRHAFALEEGQDYAHDGAKLHHLAYIAAGALIALDALLHGSLVDDRVAVSTDPDFMTALNARAAQVIASLGKPADA